MFSAIIVGAGKSTRFSEGNKLLAQLENQELVILRTCEIFLINPKIEKVIVVCDLEIQKLINEKYPNNKKLSFTSGGETRFVSVKNGLAICKTEKVLIHDGARPFLTQELLNKIIESGIKKSAVFPFIPVTNALKIITPKVKTVKREEFVQIQTPQLFDTKLIKQAYQSATHDNFYDDSQVLEEFDANVQIDLIEGDTKNKKITFIEDLARNT